VIDPGNKLQFFRSDDDDDDDAEYEKAKKIFVRSVCQFLFYL